MERLWRFSLALVLVAAAATAAVLPGCDAVKSGDRAAALALAYDVDNVKVDGRALIRLRGRNAAAWIDPVGGRVVAFRMQRRPRWVWGSDKEGGDPPMVEVPTAEGVNVLAGEGWRTVTDPPIDAMAGQTYWVVDASVRRLVLLADAVDGLRFRKAFAIEPDSSLRIDVELRNTGLEAVEVGVAAEVETAGMMREVDGGQAACIEGVCLERRRDAGGAGGFVFAKRVLRPGDKIAWSEVWRVTPERPVAAERGD